jgi:hypothetical protein
VGPLGDGPEVGHRGPTAGIGGGVRQQFDFDAHEPPVGGRQALLIDVAAECVDGEVVPQARHRYRYPKADVTQSRLRTGASQRWRLTSMLASL